MGCPDNESCLSRIRKRVIWDRTFTPFRDPPWAARLRRPPKCLGPPRAERPLAVGSNSPACRREREK
jgi:hypothetical protein